MEKNSHRFRLLYKNVIASLLIKGYSAIVALLLVPLTLECLGTLKNGVWLTISSILIWIDMIGKWLAKQTGYPYSTQRIARGQENCQFYHGNVDVYRTSFTYYYIIIDKEY